MAEKRFYWIKLKTDFFNQEAIEFLMSQENGSEYVVLYQMLCLQTANNNGEMLSRINELIVPYDVQKIVRDTKFFDTDTVIVALELFKKLGLIYEQDDNTLRISNFDEMVGSESASAKRVRKHRELKELPENSETYKKEPKSNATRQRQHRAKKQCEQKQHIPFIEDYANNKRYNGNYYVVFQRDKYKCALCGSIENLCVHHIDGFDESKPQNSNANKMITLCRCCHSNIHAGQKIDEDTLNSIDYYIDSNEMLPGNKNVTQEIEIDIDNKKENIKRKSDKTCQKELKAEFERLWKLYPRKQGKQLALQKFLKAVSDGVEIKVIENGIIAYNDYLKAKGTEEQYIKIASTWFNQRCWQDDYTITENSSVSRSRKNKVEIDTHTYNFADLERQKLKGV